MGADLREVTVQVKEGKKRNDGAFLWGARRFCLFMLQQGPEPLILQPMDAPIVIPETPLIASDLGIFQGNPFDGMIKFVVDIRNERIALGGEMHADAEAALMQTESKQEDLWGGNLHPWVGVPEVEYTSLINIRPAAGNRGLTVGSPDIRSRMLVVLKKWIHLTW
jgi:hypothetical protein